MPNTSTNTDIIHKTLIDSLDLDFTHIGGSTWQEKLDICNSCMCCSRHQHQRNKLFNFQPYCSQMSSQQGLTTNTCECICMFNAIKIYHLLSCPPAACDLPMPPLKWSKILEPEPDYDLSLLDEATDHALDHYWKDRVKACQYAIFHIC